MTVNCRHDRDQHLTVGCDIHSNLKAVLVVSTEIWGSALPITVAGWTQSLPNSAQNTPIVGGIPFFDTNESIISEWQGDAAEAEETNLLICQLYLSDFVRQFL
jgi:hypothetical protein